CGQVACLERREEVVDVVLVVRLAVMADLARRRGREMMRVAGRGVILEGLMMGRIVGPRCVNTGDGDGEGIDRRVRHDQNGWRAILMLDMRGGANRRSLRGSVRVDNRWCCWREAALEPAPADAFEIEEVADIAASHLDRSVARDGATLIGAAIVESGIGIAGDRNQWGRSCHLAFREGQGYLRIAGLTRNQVESSRCRRPERCVEGIVAHCVVLSVIPQ